MIRQNHLKDAFTNPIAVVILALLVGSRYWNPSYVWDDAEIFRHLSQTHWSDLWSESVTGGRLGDAYYRPFAMSLLKLCGDPFKVHVVVTLLHAFSALAVYRLVPKALPVVLLFVIHPLVGEVLGWASALPDALAVCFGLWAVCAAKQANWPWVLFFLLIGVLSKETAWVPLFGYLLSTQLNRGTQRQLWGVFFAALIIAFGLRLWAGAFGGDLVFFPKLAFAPKAYLWSVGSLIWPFPLSAIHDIHVLPIERVILGTGGSFVCVLGCFYSRYRAQSMTVLLSIALAVPTMTDGGLLAERYVYMAVAGACWAIGSLPLRLNSKPKWLGFTGVTLLAITILGMRIHSERALDWQDDRALFDAAVTSFPNSSFAHHFTGVVALHDNRMEDAASAFEQALKAPYAHADDSHLYMLSLVESEQYARAYDYAQAGEKDNLNALFIAYWAKSALRLGHTAQANELFAVICNGPEGCDGPGWVQELYVTGLQ